MTNNKNAFKYFLSLLQSYAAWLYLTPNSIELLRESEGYFHNGEAVKLDISPEGYVIIKRVSSGTAAKYRVYTVMTPLKKGQAMDNIEYKSQCMNSDEIPASEQEFFSECRIFAMSAFQRQCAFTFFASMHESTINAIADALTQASETLEEKTCDLKKSS